jgi:hypothetical protein
VARAKRTDRAEARRKYRAYLQAQEEAQAAAAPGDETPAGGTAAPSAKPVRGVDSRPQPGPQPGARMGLFAAAKAATRTPHYLDDIRNVRSLIFKSNAVWPILVLCVLAGAYIAARVGSSDATSDPILPFLVNFIFLPVPLLPPMLAGFLAPRSTWLAGLLASLISIAVILAVVLITSVKLSTLEPSASARPSAQASSVAVASPTPALTVLASTPSSSTPASSSTPSASPAPAGPTPSAGTGSGSGSNSNGGASEVVGLIVGGLLPTLLFGAGMGAASGWYKRFLSYTSVPRNKPPSRSSGSRSQQRRPATNARRRIGQPPRRMPL